MNLSAAILSAVGEAVERYSASLPDRELTVWKNCNELSGEFLNPRDCALYSDAQYDQADFPYVRFDPQIAHPWVLGHWAHDDSPVWVPAMYAYLSVSAAEKNVFCQGTSNGLAASTSREDAALRALFELVERDAFMTAWLTGAAGERIEPDNSLEPELRQVLDGLEAMGASIELYRLPTTTIGSAVLCLALGDGVQYPGVTFGLAADLDVRRAIRQAILEAAQTAPYLRRMMQSNQLRVPESPCAVREMLDHAAYYFPVERVSDFDRLRSGGKKVELEHVLQCAPVSDGSLRICAAHLREQGVRVALLDVTSPDIALGPFRVMRAVSPDLQPISYGYGLDFVPVKRIPTKALATVRPPIHPIW